MLWRAIPGWPSLTGFASCRRASTPATTHLPSRPHRKLRRCCGRCRRNSSWPNTISTRRLPGRGVATTAPAEERLQHLEALAAHHEQIALWAENCPATFANRAALGRRRDRAAWKAATSTPCASTNRPSARHATTASCTTRPSPTSWRAASISARGFEKIGYAHLHDARACYALLGRRRQGEAARSALSAPGRSGGAPSHGDHRLPGPATRRRERRQSLAGGLQRDRASQR